MHPHAKVLSEVTRVQQPPTLCCPYDQEARCTLAWGWVKVPMTAWPLTEDCAQKETAYLHNNIT